MANLELAEIIDTQAIRSLMDDFYKLAQVPMGLNDLKGKVLVGSDGRISVPNSIGFIPKPAGTAWKAT